MATYPITDRLQRAIELVIAQKPGALLEIAGALVEAKGKPWSCASCGKGERPELCSTCADQLPSDWLLEVEPDGYTASSGVHRGKAERNDDGSYTVTIQVAADRAVVWG